MLKRINREEKVHNTDLLNAFSVMYHLKAGEVATAEAKVKKDKYHALLERIIISLKRGERDSTSEIITETTDESAPCQHTHLFISGLTRDELVRQGT